ncbi:hypothetical protein AWB61_21020 [Chromobacterium sp. F49]|nr:hypothetical protein Cv017_17875 [Chromobacterium subtsugae]KZE85119.1 hypothetical protein AWB61_21020 [Chromobacterium sp. F49]
MEAFHHPTVAAQSLAASHPATSNSHQNSASAQVFTATAVVVAFISLQLAGLLSGPSRQTRNLRHRIKQSFEDHGIMPVGAGNAQRQWQTSAICDDVPFAAAFTSIGGVGAGLLPPGGWQR